MAELQFRILNVFTNGDEPFTGNALAVFSDASALSDDQMQALGRQLNLSETSFVVPSDDPAHPRVRIFTPAIEMTFAGHPTLGTAAVVGDLAGADAVTLQENVGDVAVRRDPAAQERWELAAPPASSQMPTASPVEVAEALGVKVGDLASTPVLLNSGSEGLLVALRSVEAIRNCRPNAEGIYRIAPSADGEPRVYVFGNDAVDPNAEQDITARMFFGQDGTVLEDPATGSQCANLGAWLAYRGFRGRTWAVRQGEQTGRPSVLHLRVDEDGAVFVGGDVREVARGNWVV